MVGRRACGPSRSQAKRCTDLAVKRAFYRLADEKREIILVACSKCDWRAAFARDNLIASHGADYAMPNLPQDGCDDAAPSARATKDLIVAGAFASVGCSC
jgi:hypothetical protein